MPEQDFLRDRPLRWTSRSTGQVLDLTTDVRGRLEQSEGRLPSPFRASGSARHGRLEVSGNR
jgi:hypothetical protein